VSGLQPAFHINHLLEIVEEHKGKKDTAIAGNAEGAPTGVTVRKQSPHCTEHVDEELKLYCETCSDVICYKCAIKGGKHHSHDYESIDEAFEKYKEEISAYLEPLGKQLTKIDQALTDLETCSATITVQQDSIETSIEETVSELYKELETRKTKLLNRVQTISRVKQKNLIAQKDQIQTTKAQLHSCEGFVGESIKTVRRYEVLKMKKTVLFQAKELTKEFPPAFLKPCTEPDVTFSAPRDVAAVLQHCGAVSSLSMVNPAKCHITGSSLELVTAVVGEESVATVQAVNWSGSPCLEPIQTLVCKLESMLTGAKVRGRVEDKGRGQYEISYQPVTKGRNLLHIRVEGESIQGSPCDVRVTSPFQYYGAPIQTFNVTGSPCGVTFNRAGELIVSAGDSAFIYTLNGNKLRSFGTRGSGRGQFVSPKGVATDDLGNILVADCDNDRIQKFTGAGQFLASVGTMGVNKLQFNEPMDVAFNAHKKKVFVVDTYNHRIQVLNPDLTISSIIGGQGGSEDGQLSYPLGVSCDNNGNVYVADTGNSRVQVFSSSGRFLRKFGAHGGNEGELDCPVGVAVDTRNMVFISEYENHRISVFTTEGQYVTSFRMHGERFGELSWPGLIAVDDCGVLAVCDIRNSQVQIF
jgi:tripartite motif-containing protein 2/3/tripartite motif-containing protein 71